LNTSRDDLSTWYTSPSRVTRRRMVTGLLGIAAVGLLAACQQGTVAVAPTPAPTQPPASGPATAVPTAPAAATSVATTAPTVPPPTTSTAPTLTPILSTTPGSVTPSAPAPAGTVPAATSTAAAQSGVLPGASKTGPGMILKNITPPLAESPLDQIDGLVTPNYLHFVRNHYNGFPTIDQGTWKLTVSGVVARPLELSLTELRGLPTKTLTMVLECAGNTRGRFVPVTEGTQWGNGAASVAEYTGVPVADVMKLAGIKESAVDLVFASLDSGKVTRGLNKQKALDPDTMLVWAMNGEPLPIEHGFPIRVIVPGWIGVAHIKWLGSIEALDKPYDGFYNTRQYVYLKQGQESGGTPMTTLPIKSVLARPRPGTEVPVGPTTLSGFAWSGGEKITKVEVSTDGGATYKDARIEEPVLRWSWVRWQFTVDAPPGTLSVATRATDAAGNVQPRTVEWNRFGYGYNAIQSWQLGVGQPLSPVASVTTSATGTATAATLPAATPTTPPASPAPTGAATPARAAAVTVGATGGSGQIARGAQIYGQACAACHGAGGQGSPAFPKLVGNKTLAGFGNAKNLFDYVKAAMPQDRPGSLSDDDYYAVTAYLVAQNGVNADGAVTVDPKTAATLSLK